MRSLAFLLLIGAALAQTQNFTEVLVDQSVTKHRGVSYIQIKLEGESYRNLTNDDNVTCDAQLKDPIRRSFNLSNDEARDRLRNWKTWRAPSTEALDYDCCVTCKKIDDNDTRKDRFLKVTVPYHIDTIESVRVAYRNYPWDDLQRYMHCGVVQLNDTSTHDVKTHTHYTEPEFALCEYHSFATLAPSDSSDSSTEAVVLIVLGGIFVVGVAGWWIMHRTRAAKKTGSSYGSGAVETKVEFIISQHPSLHVSS